MSGHRIGASLGIAAVSFGFALLAAGAADASERRFTYTYGSAVLGKGDAEFEPWTTIRAGREDWFLRFDERLEFEVGITDRLQSAWYVNFTGLREEEAGAYSSEFEFKGVSWELKGKLLDPVADPLGMALYFEVGAGPDEVEIEAKLILDKHVGKFFLAFNAVGEVELEFEDDEVKKEGILELDLGLGFMLTKRFSLGVEARSHTEIVPGEGLEHSVLFVGPTLAYSEDKWWVAVTALPQVAMLAGEHDGALDLHDHERVEGRVLFGFHL